MATEGLGRNDAPVTIIPRWMRDGVARFCLETSGAEDGGDDFVGRERVDGDGGVGGAVERAPALVAGGEIGVVGQDRPRLFGPAAARQRGGEFDFEVDEQAAGRVKQEIAGVGAFDGAAAQSEDEIIGRDEAGDDCVLEIAEVGLAVARKDFCDGAAGFSFEDIVGIKETPAQAACDERADGGFAGAHEAGEDDAAGLLIRFDGALAGQTCCSSLNARVLTLSV